MKMLMIIAGAAGVTAAAPQAGDLAAKVEQMFAVADMNADKALSEQEYVDYAVARAKTDFAAMAGVDGALSREELSAAWTKAAAEREAEKPAPTKAPKN